jgi:hypothetical protein
VRTGVAVPDLISTATTARARLPTLWTAVWCAPGKIGANANPERVNLLNRTGSYFHGRAAYSDARPPYERALAIDEKMLYPRPCLHKPVPRFQP